MPPITLIMIHRDMLDIAATGSGVLLPYLGTKTPAAKSTHSHHVLHRVK